METAEAHAFLNQRYGSSIVSVTALAEGEWSSAFVFRLADAEYVARFSDSREDFDKDRRAAGHRAPELPVPQVIEIGESYEGFYAISERLAGEYLDNLTHERMLALLPSLLSTLDAARGVDLADTSGYGRWDASGNAPHHTWRDALLDVVSGPAPINRTHEWRERLDRSPTGASPFDEAFAVLGELTAHVPNERHLIHSDLLHYNVLVSDDRISAVLDWGNSMYGDFLYDVAWLCFWSPWYPEWQSIDFRQQAVAHFAAIDLDVPRFEERLRCCQIHIGLDGQAYCAFGERWHDLDAIATRTLAIAHGRE